MIISFAAAGLAGNKAMELSLRQRPASKSHQLYSKPAAHHKKWSFQQEYRRLLEAFEVEFDERYIFKEPV